MSNHRLNQYLPEETITLLTSQWQTWDAFTLRISKPRKTKLGDFRFPHQGKPPAISINNDLSPGEFLLTLVHELAHYKVFLEHNTRVKPHGVEWKNTFRQLFAPHFSSSVYSEKQRRALAKYFQNVKSSSCYDLELLSALRGQKPKITLESLPSDTTFSVSNGLVLTKVKKMRTRYRCIEKSTGKIYSVHPLTEIVPLHLNSEH